LGGGWRTLFLESEKTFQIYSRQKLEEKLIDMHMNPVCAGLVEKTVDWKWSSARWYEQQQSVGVPISWID
jgi:putative transposase